MPEMGRIILFINSRPFDCHSRLVSIECLRRVVRKVGMFLGRSWPIKGGAGNIYMTLIPIGRTVTKKTHINEFFLGEGGPVNVFQVGSVKEFFLIL